MMKTLFHILIAILMCFTLTAQEREYSRKLILMGDLFEFTVVAEEDEEQLANELIDTCVGEVKRIGEMISVMDDRSQASMVNKNAGIAPVRVDPEFYSLIERALAISGLTGGTFDITYASMDEVWKFDGSMKDMPGDPEIAASVSKVGYQDIVLDPSTHTVFLKEKGMKIGLAGIGRGYALDRVLVIMKEGGMKGGVVRAGGDLYAWGKDARGEPWRVGVNDPRDKEKIAVWFNVNNSAVITSGSYDQYIEIKGWRFAPVIDPRTGWPVEDIRSVTVVCSNAELADGLATAIFVMGRDEGINLVNGLNGVDCLIIDEEGRIWTSKHLTLNVAGDGGVHFTVGK